MCNIEFVLLLLSLLLIPLLRKQSTGSLLLSGKNLLKRQEKCFISEKRCKGDLIQRSKCHASAYEDSSSAANATRAIPIVKYFGIVRAVTCSKHQPETIQTDKMPDHKRTRRQNPPHYQACKKNKG